MGPHSTGTSWFVHVSADEGVFSSSTPPAGASPDEYFRSTAALNGALTPSAVVQADYLLEAQNAINDQAPDHRWLYLDDVRSFADCRSPEEVTAGTTAAHLWVRQPDRTLARVPVPDAGETYEAEGIRLRLPRTTTENQYQEQYADVSVRRVTGPSDLVGTDQWRTGEVNAASGWRVEVTSYVLEDGFRTDTTTSVLILGGATCSVPETSDR